MKRAAAVGPFAPLRSFLGDADLRPRAALAVLRAAFLAFFVAHGVVALLVAAALGALAGAGTSPTPWVGSMVVGASTAQLLLGVAVTAFGVRSASRAAALLRAEREAPTAPSSPDGSGGEAAATAARRAFAARLRAARGAALWAAVMAAVLLSTPAWFAAFAWLAGNRGAALPAAAALLAVGYAFGFLQLVPLARGVASTGRPSHRAPSAKEHE